MRITTYSVTALQGPVGIDSSTIDLGPAGQLGVGGAWARVAPGLRSVANQHDEIETWVVVAGEGRVFADAARQRVAAGDVVQFEPFETHFVENTGDADLVFASLYWRDGERARRVATGAEHRRFHERPVFVFSEPRAALAADVFVRFQRMTGATAWRVNGDGADPAGLEAFAARLAASPAVTPGASPPRVTLDLRALREELDAQHRAGRVPPPVKDLTARLADQDRLDAGVGDAFGALHGIEALGGELGRDWRADAPQDDWKLVRFLGPDPAAVEPALLPLLCRLAHPGWTPDVDYHVCDAPETVGDVARLATALGVLEDGASEVVDGWRRWLADLGARVEARYGAVRDAGIWTPEQTAFLARLESRLTSMAGSLGQDGFSLRRAAETLSGIADDATGFAPTQAPLAEMEAWKDEARTAVALELAAARLLALCAAPLMPAFAARLAAALGESGTDRWPDRVALVAPGTRLGLGAVAEEPPLLPWLSGLVRGALRLPDGAPVRDRTLVGLGMESLQAIALQYQILDQVGADVTIQDLLGGRDVAELAAFIAAGLEPAVVAARARVGA